MKNTHKLAVVAGLALTMASANAALVSQYGILDLTANGGINPNTGAAWADGDEYRLAFYTDGKLTASSADINVHNAAVTAEAQLNATLSGSSWTAMVSTLAVNVKDNTGTSDLTGGAGIGGAGVPVYAMDGSTAIARNNADIWNAWSSPFAKLIQDLAGTVRLRAQPCDLTELKPADKPCSITLFSISMELGIVELFMVKKSGQERIPEVIPTLLNM